MTCPFVDRLSPASLIAHGPAHGGRGLKAMEGRLRFPGPASLWPTCKPSLPCESLRRNSSPRSLASQITGTVVCRAHHSLKS